MAFREDFPRHGVVDGVAVLAEPFPDAFEQVDLPLVEGAVGARVHGNQQAAVARHEVAQPNNKIAWLLIFHALLPRPVAPAHGRGGVVFPRPVDEERALVAVFVGIEPEVFPEVALVVDTNVFAFFFGHVEEVREYALCAVAASAAIEPKDVGLILINHLLGHVVAGFRKIVLFAHEPVIVPQAWVE